MSVLILFARTAFFTLFSRFSSLTTSCTWSSFLFLILAKHAFQCIRQKRRFNIESTMICKNVRRIELFSSTISEVSRLLFLANSKMLCLPKVVFWNSLLDLSRRNKHCVIFLVSILTLLHIHKASHSLRIEVLILHFVRCKIFRILVLISFILTLCVLLQAWASKLFWSCSWVHVLIFYSILYFMILLLILSLLSSMTFFTVSSFLFSILPWNKVVMLWSIFICGNSFLVNCFFDYFLLNVILF